MYAQKIRDKDMMATVSIVTTWCLLGIKIAHVSFFVSFFFYVARMLSWYN